MGEKNRKVKSRNMYKEPMDMDNGVRIDCGRRGVGRVRESNRGKIETTVIE